MVETSRLERVFYEWLKSPSSCRPEPFHFPKQSTLHHEKVQLSQAVQSILALRIAPVKR